MQSLIRESGSVKPRSTSTMCYLHPSSPSVGSCGKCLRPACDLCLNSRAGWLSNVSWGTSPTFATAGLGTGIPPSLTIAQRVQATKVCPLCVRYQSALHWAIGIAIIIFIVSFASIRISPISYLGMFLSPLAFVLVRRLMRKAAERELGVRR